MNITRLNTLNDDKVIIKKEEGNGGGGSRSNYKYYDCSKDTLDENGRLPHGIYLADSMKIIKIETNEIMIAPEANFGPGTTCQVLAVAYDMSKKIYIDGEWVDAKTYYKELEGFDFSEHQEITEEEFYHIPQDEVWPLNTQEDYKSAWDKLYPLVERYGADYINENKLSLAPWYKSLTIGDEVVTELSWYSLAEDGDSKREHISFTQYTGIEKYTYTDGTIEYQSYNPPM